MDRKRKNIVITSIYEPTKAVKVFSEMSDYKLIVIGDKKTPADWNCKNVDYFSVEEQERFDFQLVKNLPYNHYSRKMIGYLKSIMEGAEYIVDTDDDNIPKTNWNFPLFEETYSTTTEGMGFVNVYELFTDQKIWPRGLPLRLISKKFDLEKSLSKKKVRVGVWQGLSDEDADVDAIYRLTNNSPCFFTNREPIVLGKGTLSPFNTQNTIVRRELFPLLYLPAYVTFRFTDILRGLIAQPIMWLYDYQLGFTDATVVQKRNPHDFMKDFISEVPMYENTEKIVEIVSDSISTSKDISGNMLDSYRALFTEKLICKDELALLEVWLEDIGKYI